MHGLLPTDGILSEAMSIICDVEHKWGTHPSQLFLSKFWCPYISFWSTNQYSFRTWTAWQRTTLKWEIKKTLSRTPFANLVGTLGFLCVLALFYWLCRLICIQVIFMQQKSKMCLLLHKSLTFLTLNYHHAGAKSLEEHFQDVLTP